MKNIFIILMLLSTMVNAQPGHAAAAIRKQSTSGTTPPVPPTVVSLIGVDSAKFYGNSITLGLNATAPDYDSAFRNRFTDETGIPHRQFASSGTGLWYSHTEVLKDTMHGTARSATILAAGYNDVRYLGADSALMKRFRETIRMAGALQFMKRSTFKAAGDCSVNSIFNWTNN